MDAPITLEMLSTNDDAGCDLKRVLFGTYTHRASTLSLPSG